MGQKGIGGDKVCAPARGPPGPDGQPGHPGQSVGETRSMSDHLVGDVAFLGPPVQLTAVLIRPMGW